MRTRRLGGVVASICLVLSLALVPRLFGGSGPIPLGPD